MFSWLVVNPTPPPTRKDVRRKSFALVVAIVLAASGGILIWEYSSDQGPFCSGYPPGGNCPGKYEYSFRIAVNYQGQWVVTWYGYHGAGVDFGQTGNYTGGAFGGVGNASRDVALSGPNASGLALCVQAEKLDTSSSTLTLTLLNQTNETSLPHGGTTVCAGVVP